MAFALPRVAPTDVAMMHDGAYIDSAAAPATPPWILWAGVLVAGVGIAARVLRPLDRNARWVIAGGFALVVLSLFVGTSDWTRTLPYEFWIYLRPQLGGHASLFDTFKAGMGNDFTVRFLSLWHLALPVGIAGAFALAWHRPEGPWDTKGSGLRVLGYVLVLYIALTSLLYAFNLAGWSPPNIDTDNPLFQQFVRNAFAARARMALVALGGTAWIVGGATALYLRFAPSGAAVAAAPAAPAATATPTKTA
jgi:hypothetical protein